MVDNKSLKDVCILTNASRRAIQGYEKYGLVRPSGKKYNWYLLYDDEAIYRIAFIKYCQDIGFSLKEIKSFIDEDESIIQENLYRQLDNIKFQHDKLVSLYDKTKIIIELLKEKGSKDKIFKIITNLLNKEERRNSK